MMLLLYILFAIWSILVFICYRSLPVPKQQESLPEDQKMPKKNTAFDILTRDTKLAVHESGHTVVGWLCTTTTQIPSVTIENANGGITMIYSFIIENTNTNINTNTNTNTNNAWCKLVIDLAGVAAESFVFGKPVQSKPAASDLSKALSKAKMLIGTKPPWDIPAIETSLPFEKMFTEITLKEAAVLKHGYAMAKRLITKHSVGYYRLVNTLLAKKTITEEDIKEALGSREAVKLWGRFSGKPSFL